MMTIRGLVAQIAFRVALVLTAITTMFSIACGSETESVPVGELTAGVIVDSQHTYTLDEFTAAGFKSSKDYDISDLPHAVSAHYGFWGLDPYNRNDYEIRFYPGHKEAIDYGEALAAERVGKDAKLTEETATWKVGVRDARECHGALGQAQHAASCLEAKYYDYMIVGNAILLCGGDAVDVARQNCEQLLAQLE